MSKDVAPNYGTTRGYSLQAVRASYVKHERVIATPGFYMRETYVRAERAQISVSPVQGIEAKVQPSQIPQIFDHTKIPRIFDASIVNRIAPKEKPKVYDQRKVGYLAPRNVSSKPKGSSRAKPLYEMLGSNLPNDFYLTSKDIKDAYGKIDDAYLALIENSLKKDTPDRYKNLEKPLDSRSCKRCGTPTKLADVCNNCIALN